MPGASTNSTTPSVDSACAAGVRPEPKPARAKRHYGMIPPGSALVEADGRVNLANPDMHWARFAPNGGALIAIHVKRRQIGLFALSDGSPRPPCTVPIHTHSLNTSLVIDRELNQIGVDRRRAPGSPGSPEYTVGVVRVRRQGCGTRYLVLKFPDAALKPRARKNKHTSPLTSGGTPDHGDT